VVVSDQVPPATETRPTAPAAGAVGALVLSALVNHRLAQRAERDNPPAGRFIELDGVRLHYVEQGEGEPLFGPAPVPEKFTSFPSEMALRPLSSEPARRSGRS
jgi:hypothetical protein